MPFSFNENVQVLFQKLEEFFTSKTVVGEAIKVGDTTLIPIVNISFGLGVGGGDGTDPKGSKGEGGGGGVGAKATVSAIVVIKGEKVELIPIKSHSGLEKLLEMVPDIVSKVKPQKEEKCCEKENKE